MDQVTFDITPVNHSAFPFIVLPDALILLLDELGINPKEVDVVIDGKEGLYTCFEGRFHSSSFANSKEEPMIRICDHLVGLISRMCYALRNDLGRREASPNASFEEKNRLHILRSEWFEISEDIFNLYKQTFVVLVQNNQHYWTTLTTALSDDLTYFITLLAYFHYIESYDEYMKKTSAEHSRLFEQFSIYCIEKIPEQPTNPLEVFKKYNSRV